jgi:hypothetical protein
MPTGVMSWSQTPADNATADSNVSWPEGMAPSAINNSARGEMASVAKYRDDTAGTLTTGGSSTAYTVTTNQTFASLAELDGNELVIKFHTASGAAPTLAVDGLAAKAINFQTATAAPAGAIMGNTIHRVTYDNTNSVFVLSGWFKVQVNSQTAETSPAADDEVVIYDSSASDVRKMTLANLFKTPNVLTTESVIATDDVFNIYDSSAAAARGVSVTNLFKGVNALTEDTSPDQVADFLLTYDASASAAKKVKPHNFTGMARAWAYVTFSGGTPTLVTSYNVSGITDNGLGDITLTYTTAAPSANYCAIAQIADIAASVQAGPQANVKSRATGSARVQVLQATSSSDTTAIAQDLNFMFVAYW